MLESLLLAVLRQKVLLLAVGGAAGTLARYGLGRWVGSLPWAQEFPFGTLLINVSGSFVLALAAGVILERLPPEYQNLYLLVGVGFCGGYTTFSTFEYETYRLVSSGSWALALANVAGSVVAGFAGVLLGVALVNALFPR